MHQKYSVRRMPLAVVLANLCLTATYGCSSGSDDSKTATKFDCSTVAVPEFADLDFSTCTGCHSSTLSGVARVDAPVGVDFDTYLAAKADPAEIVEVLEEGTMPPDGNAQPSQAVRDAIATWASCGTPE